MSCLLRLIVRMFLPAESLKSPLGVLPVILKVLVLLFTPFLTEFRKELSEWIDSFERVELLTVKWMFTEKDRP